MVVDKKRFEYEYHHQITAYVVKENGKIIATFDAETGTDEDVKIIVDKMNLLHSNLVCEKEVNGVLRRIMMTEREQYINECQCCDNCESITIMDNMYFRCMNGNPLWIKCNDFVEVELPTTQRK